MMFAVVVAPGRHARRRWFCASPRCDMLMFDARYDVDDER